MAETVYLTMARQQMLDVRAKAANRERPESSYCGQLIIGYHEFRTGGVQLGGQRHAIVVLADGTRVEIDEDRD
jgi:hypothetical protein